VTVKSLHILPQMKQSSPLILLVGFTLATLAYGGKLAEMPSDSHAYSIERAPASSAPQSKIPEKPARISEVKTAQANEVTTDFRPLEIEAVP
jgi:hypothetical protein